MQHPKAADITWIGADWGGSNLRVYGFDDGGALLCEARSTAGTGSLSPSDFEPALMALIGDWLLADRSYQVIICGMAGAREGWAEAGYAHVPSAPLAEGFTRAPAMDPRLDIRLISGLAQASPADVMRGEETQIAGFLALHPKFDGVLCLPGTHTKWAHISAGEVVSFQTVMTGDLFAALSTQTVLRHSLQEDGSPQDDAGFLAAVSDAIARPERIAAALFTIRAEGLLNGLAAGQARARVSGLLIGAELAATRPYWLGQNIALIGAAELSARYDIALRAQGALPTIAAAEEMTREGLNAARNQWRAKT
ncbi:MAG: 2-dehydro-3-deoxygalactonokinase [Paracoccaceae bacterium]